ncbi:Cyclic dehypoxanthine futalosine synthase [hydrothermal vent metagenome]|uniref:Cyclic dehypoxanthine futalosine synthase n=1 Tax=hydrothermal vent metagenome TaxID=652676 RepID=A0A3B1C665_9ZZZZ
MSNDTIRTILERVAQGEKLSDVDAVLLLESSDLVPIGRSANEARMKIKPEPCVTYIVDRNINYTNICVSKCGFCAFYRTEGDSDGYTLSENEIDKKIEETISLGGVQILMQGGHHPTHKIGWYEDMVSAIKQKHDIHVHAFSPPEIVHIAELSGITVTETIERLMNAGLDSIPGGGAEVLSDRVRDEVSPLKCSADEWIDVMRCAHKLGMKTTATMMFGHRETLPERVESMRRIRDLQDETGGFTAFIPWTFQPANTDMADIPETGGFDYLKTLAVCRLYLNNIENIQASWVTQGPKVAQMALYFGANDMGSTMIEENVVASAGVAFRMSEKDIRRTIEDTGMTPKRRNMTYELIG